MAKKKAKKQQASPQQEETHAEIVMPEQSEEETQQEPETRNLSAAEFVRNNTRRHRVRANSTKLLRLNDEVGFVNAFTEQYLKGEIGESDIKILADVKAFLKQLPNNPYNLKDNEANAFVCNDMKHLCIHGETLHNEHMKLRAISLSTNRVGYFNPILARQLIADEEDEAVKTAMQERLEKLESYPNRDGYGIQ